MRQIKFRAKDTFKSEFFPQRWLYGTPVQDGDDVWMCVKKEDKGIVSVKVDPSTLGQFTGITDRSGREVYEGDIISWISAMGRSARRIQGVVVWDQNTMSWSIARDIAITRSYTQHEVSRLAGKSPVEVIGNIHDNPELIE